jgi:DNA polymerase-3 subunit alpha
MSTQARFIHLRTHTEYSLLEGAIRVKKLAGMCEAAGMPAVAVTDTNNMFAALEFSEYASGEGIQPIVGCQIDLSYDPSAPGEKLRLPAPIVLLAQNERGYENLMKLNSCAYLDKGGDLVQVTPAELAQYSEGLICLTGGPDGPVGRFLRNGQRPKAQALMTQLAEVFGDRLYVELQRHPVDGGLPDAERLCNGVATGRDQ